MLNVETREQKPYRVNGVFVVAVIDSWRLWLRWWEGRSQRDYFKVQVAEKIMDIFLDNEGWKLAKIED